MQKQSIAGFYVAGFSARTNNSQESGPDGVIPKLWSRFFQHPPALTHKLGDEIYAVYTDYESDHTGDYTFLLGNRVSSTEDLPDGIASLHVSGGEFAVMTSAPGPAARVVPAVWQKIWKMTAEDLQGIRAYETDFELYDHRAANPDLTQVDVYLSLKP